MKAFIIYLPERENSVTQSARMLTQLHEYGIEAELYPGVPGDIAVTLAEKEHRVCYPFSIKSHVLSDEEIQEYIRPERYNEFVTEHRYTIARKLRIGDSPRYHRPGVIGCFYSHHRLWRKCVDLGEPIMIFEDDVKFYRTYQPVEYDGVLILSLGIDSFYDDPWKTYLEKPSGGPQAVTWKKFSMPGNSGYLITPKAALHLFKFYNDYYYPADNAINKSICSIQCHSYLMGRNFLPEEGNESMTRYKGWLK